MKGGIINRTYWRTPEQQTYFAPEFFGAQPETYKVVKYHIIDYKLITDEGRIQNEYLDIKTPIDWTRLTGVYAHLLNDINGAAPITDMEVGDLILHINGKTSQPVHLPIFNKQSNSVKKGRYDYFKLNEPLVGATRIQAEIEIYPTVALPLALFTTIDLKIYLRGVHEYKIN